MREDVLWQRFSAAHFTTTYGRRGIHRAGGIVEDLLASDFGELTSGGFFQSLNPYFRWCLNSQSHSPAADVHNGNCNLGATQLDGFIGLAGENKHSIIPSRIK